MNKYHQSRMYPAYHVTMAKRKITRFATLCLLGFAIALVLATIILVRA